MKLIAAGLMALGLTLTASAQDTSRDAELVMAIDKAGMRYVIESAGYTVTGDLSSGIGLTGEDTNGIKFGLEGTACREDDTCLGLHMYLQFNDVGTEAYANKVNRSYAAIKATAFDENRLRLSRYLILDHGQTLENVRASLTVMQAIALSISNDDRSTDGDAPDSDSTDAAASLIAWGDDSGEYANDSECDDARFHENGDDAPYKRQHVLRDATDCRNAFEAGSVQLLVDFGDNSGDYTNDDECDDNRFTGEGRSILTTDSQVKRDSADCIAAYRTERLNRP